jgi:hypothetical protein
MTGNQFINYHAEVVKKMNDIVKVKNTDYSGGGDSDAFNNFTMVEKKGVCSTEAGFLVRMEDKMMRINNLIKNGGAAVKDESIRDTLMDLANYSILMMGYIDSKHVGWDEAGLKNSETVVAEYEKEEKDTIVRRPKHKKREKKKERIPEYETEDHEEW